MLLSGPQGFHAPFLSPLSQCYHERSTMEMERLPAVEEEEQQHGFFSCWGSLCRTIRRLRRRRLRRGKLYVRRGSFKYDPLSYSKNFDDGGGSEEAEEAERSYRGFSSRYAAPRPLGSGQPRSP